MDNLLKNFIIDDNFMGKYVELITKEVIPYQEKILQDEIEGIEKSHAIENFKAAAEMIETGKCSEEFYGMVFQDSDVAKWLEAAAYSQVIKPDQRLAESCEEVIELIGRAQHKNGYLNTYFTVKEPSKEWTNLCEAHELYCAGHMIEAAVAYAECTGKTKLLEIMCKMADHMYEHFIVEKSPGYPGHPEVELALMRLYNFTQNKKYKELAEHFINIRGIDSDYFIKESKQRGWTVWGNKGEDKEYAQNQCPVREQQIGGKIKVETNYTLEGTVKYSFKPTKEFMEMTLAIRIPYWSRNTKIIMNGETLDYKAIKGYVYLKSKFKNTDEIVVIFNMEPQRVFAASNVAADSGKVSLMRGPLIYCAEGIDNGGNVLNKLLSREAAINTTPLEDFPGNYFLEVAGYANKKSNELYSFVRPENIPCNIRFIPYYLWGNRGLTEMRVWIPEI